ncbi:Uncharacterised protein [Klebsiella variicola]|nr:Uncharacterised protein [Klebsiella variicola]
MGFSIINCRENVAGAVIQELFRQRDAERFGLLCWPAPFAAYHLRTIRGANQRPQPQFAVDEFRIAANWHLTTAFEAGVHRPFGAHAYRGFRMVEGR